MTQITVKVEAGEVKTKFAKLGLAIDRLPTRVIRAEIEAAKELVREYPDELPDQKYVRTMKRYYATKLEKVDNKTYRIVSNPRYADGRSGNPYVIGDAAGRGQADIHFGRWTTLYMEVYKAMQRIRERGEEYFRAVLERNGAP